jgi:D-3-phosphoglycerate dehydrogenase intervening domain
VGAVDAQQCDIGGRVTSDELRSRSFFWVAWPSSTRGLLPPERWLGCSASASRPVNEVNAVTLPHRRGITVREIRSEEAHDYLSLVKLRAKTAETLTSVAGTLLGDCHPRLVRIDDYHV